MKKIYKYIYNKNLYYKYLYIKIYYYYYFCCYLFLIIIIYILNTMELIKFINFFFFLNKIKPFLVFTDFK